jgi:hypothetical protein
MLAGVKCVWRVTLFLLYITYAEIVYCHFLTMGHLEVIINGSSCCWPFNLFFFFLCPITCHSVLFSTAHIGILRLYTISRVSWCNSFNLNRHLIQNQSCHLLLKKKLCISFSITSSSITTPLVALSPPPTTVELLSRYLFYCGPVTQGSRATSFGHWEWFGHPPTNIPLSKKGNWTILVIKS